ncbi:unnamed protein product, partial [Staurois parvus]
RSTAIGRRRNQERAESWRPREWSFLRRRGWSTVSKAAERSCSRVGAVAIGWDEYGVVAIGWE